MTLEEYLKSHSISVSDFAASIGARSRATIYRYMRNNGECLPRIPDPDMIKRIAEVTKGEVTANDFYGISTVKHTRPIKAQPTEVNTV